MIGEPIRRREDARLVTGGGTFSGDRHPENLRYMAFARSPFAHARVVGVGLDTARALDGVLQIWTAADLPAPATELKDVPIIDNAVRLRRTLAQGEVLYEGEPVVAVVAETAAIAADAAALVDVSYEGLPAVNDVVGASQHKAPNVHADLKTNLAFKVQRCYGDPIAAFGTAAHIVKGSFVLPRVK